MASLPQSQHPGPPPHHRLVLGENGAPSKLPIRQVGKHFIGFLIFVGLLSYHSIFQRHPGQKTSPPPAKKQNGLGCCSGHFVVIWIILGIVTFGVLLGVVLKFTVS